MSCGFGYISVCLICPYVVTDVLPSCVHVFCVSSLISLFLFLFLYLFAISNLWFLSVFVYTSMYSVYWLLTLSCCPCLTIMDHFRLLPFACVLTLALAFDNDSLIHLDKACWVYVLLSFLLHLHITDGTFKWSILNSLTKCLPIIDDMIYEAKNPDWIHNSERWLTWKHRCHFVLIGPKYSCLSPFYRTCSSYKC